MAIKTYEDNGVILSKKTFYCGDKLEISYSGLLARAGAEGIFLHAGYGSGWDNSSFIKMEKVPDGFKAEIEILDGKSLGICFKDSADNWDNNSGDNYNFKITAKSLKKSEKITKSESGRKSESSKQSESGRKSESTKKSQSGGKSESSKQPVNGKTSESSKNTGVKKTKVTKTEVKKSKATKTE